MARPVVRAVFALIVVATIAAFFATQQLKSETPLVLRFAATPKNISPNGDRFKDSIEVGFDLSEPAEVTFSILDTEGNEVRRMVDNRELAGDTKHRFRWDGRDEEGRRAPDGLYRMRVVRRDEGRVIDSAKRIRVDTVPPQVELVSATPSVIAPGSSEVRLRYRGPRNDAPEFRVFRTDDAPEPHVVRRFRGDGRSGTWHGEVATGPEETGPAPDGDYAFTVSVRDRAGNLTVAPSEIPRPRTARPNTGVSVRSFTLTGPLDVVPAGGAATLEVGPIDRSLDFVVSRLGDPEPIRRGGRVAGQFRVHIPSDTKTGVYLVRVRSTPQGGTGGDRRAVWPLAVAGLPQKKGAAERRPLVVLPAITWQGLNAVDYDHDGFPDSFPRSRVLGMDRPFEGGAMPSGFDAEVAPLLLYLDRERLAYDLTTGPRPVQRSGNSSSAGGACPRCSHRSGVPLSNREQRPESARASNESSRLAVTPKRMPARARTPSPRTPRLPGVGAPPHRCRLPGTEDMRGPGLRTTGRCPRQARVRCAGAGWRDRSRRPSSAMLRDAPGDSTDMHVRLRWGARPAAGLHRR
jgi:hypothetical protein